MEKWQQKHIKDNLPSLLKLTSINALLLAQLEATSVLTEIDVQKIEAEITKIGKSNLLYKILLNQANGYLNLMQALHISRQTGALKIFYTIPTETLENLKINFIGKTHAFKSLLNTFQIESIHHKLSENLCYQETYKILEIVSKQDTVMDVVRDTIPPRYFLYFPRQLSRHVVVSPTIFNEEQTDIFVFKNAKRAQLRRFISYYAIESSTELLLKDKISAHCIVLDVESDWQRICDKVNSPVHLIRFEDVTETFLLEATSGASDTMHKYLNTGDDDCKSESISEDEFVEGLLAKHVKGVCICDSPGMGKSLLLANLARKVSVRCSNRIVAFIQLRNFTPLYINGCPKSALIEHISTSVLAKYILIEKMKATNVKFELFFDGFDEVPESRIDAIISFLQKITTSLPQAKVIVTSRPVMRGKLEQSIGVIAYNIQPFNEETQVRFLTSYWIQKEPKSNVNKLNDYASFCLNRIKNVLKEKESIITGVPLQCKLIADVYSNDAGIYADPKRKVSVKISESFANSLTEIYSRFMICQLGETKCSFDCMTKMDYIGTQCDTNCQVKSFHIWLALKLIFPNTAKKLSSQVANFECLSSQHILSPGILEKGQNENQYEFWHRTFAEYLVAEYLSKTVFTDSASDKFKRNSYRHLIEQSVYDSVFVSGERIKSWIPRRFLEHYTLRENVVAHFLNDFISKPNIFKYHSCIASLSPLNSTFFPALEGCLHGNYEGLLQAFMNAAANSKTKCETINIKELQLVMCVAAGFCSEKTVHKLFQFFQNILKIDLINTEFHNAMSNPMQVAVRRADYEIVRYFADKISIQNKGLLHCCIEWTYFLDEEHLEKRLEIANLLLSKCPSLINESYVYMYHNIHCKTPLLAEYIHLRAIKTLVEKGAQIKVADDKERTVFYLAAGYMKDDDLLNLADFLFDTCNARIWFLDSLKCKTYLNSTNFRISCMGGWMLKRLPFLISLASNNLDFKSGHNFELAIKNQQHGIDILTKLLSAKLYQLYKPMFQNLFYWAVKKGQVEIANLLMNFDYSLIEKRDENNLTPLMLAAWKNQIEMIRLLISKRANTFAVNSEGETVLHLAAMASSCDTFYQVISIVGEQWSASLKFQGFTFQTSLDNQKAPENLHELFNWQENKLKMTALHYALYTKTALSLSTLDLYLACGQASEMKRGVDINAVDLEGRTVLAIALRKQRSFEFVKHLVNRGADWSIRSKHGNNATHLCASFGLVEHLKYFVELGCNFNEIDGDGDNALQCAIHDYTSSITVLFEIIRILISAGVNKSNKNLEGKTAYDYAVEKGYPSEILDLL